MTKKGFAFILSLAILFEIISYATNVPTIYAATSNDNTDNATSNISAEQSGNTVTTETTSQIGNTITTEITTTKDDIVIARTVIEKTTNADGTITVKTTTITRDDSGKISISSNTMLTDQNGNELPTKNHQKSKKPLPQKLQMSKRPTKISLLSTKN